MARHSGDGGVADFALDDFLPYRLSIVTNRISQAFARRYSEAFGLAIPEWRVMAVLGNFAPLTANQLCQRTAMDKVKVSRAVASLVAAGHVRKGANPADQRSTLLRLTPKGRRTYRRIVPQALDLEAALTAVLAPGERQALTATLAKLEACVAELE
ncbi:MAG: MarR family winged helix-turn-helix transcriptional regulator [Alphaproteobacteria bacterium]|jgi:DNA-binding MarR family transcriptional regulator